MSKRQDNQLHKWVNESNTGNHTLNQTQHNLINLNGNGPKNQNTVNRSQTERAKSQDSRRTRFVVDPDNNEFEPEMSGAKTPSSKWALDNSQSFRSDVDKWNVHPEYKTMLDQTHTAKQQNEEYKNIENHALHNEVNELKADLERVQGENSLLKTKLSHKDEVLATVTSENERLQLYETENSKKLIANEKELNEVRNKMQESQASLKKEIADKKALNTEKNKIMVESTTAKAQVEELQVQVAALEKSLDVQDTSLVSKLKIQDVKFEKMAQEHKRVEDYGNKVAKLQHVIEENSKDQRLGFENTAKKVVQLELCVGKMEDSVCTLQGAVRDIAASLAKLNSIIGDKLVEEILASQEKREELKRNTTSLNEAHTDMKSKVLDNLSSFRRDLDDLMSLKTQTLRWLILPVVFISILCLMVGYNLKNLRN